jgi:uncharacterized membrane protein
MTAALRVVAPGLMTTVQDLGRPGYQHLGVPVSGALEVTAPGATVFRKPGGTFVVAGADDPGAGVDQPAQGEFFGFASMLEQTPHQTDASALDEAVCIEVERHDIAILLDRKPHAGMDMLAVLGRQFHASQHLVRIRATRNPQDIIEEEETFGERVADKVASFGGSWTFIVSFGIVLLVYVGLNIALAMHAWDPYPFILLNLFLSMLAAIQAPIIMMSQNRQATKDRLQADLDYQVNLKAELQIRSLHLKIDELRGSELRDFVEIQREQLTLQRQQMEIIRQLGSMS